MISEYKHELLIGKPCMVHPIFVPSMDLFCSYLKIVECKFHVTNSFRRDEDVLTGTVVAQKRMSNHKVGCAIDGNLVTKNNTYWTNEKIKKEGLRNEQLVFVKLIRNSRSLRYGGDFEKEHEKDRVHYDNALNILNPKLWHQIYNQLKTKPMENTTDETRVRNQQGELWMGRDVVMKGTANLVSLVPTSIVFKVTGETPDTIQINDGPTWIEKDKFEFYPQ